MKEIAQLVNNFDKVSDGSYNNILILVHGYSGIGKTRLIKEVHKPLARDRGYFTVGKFDQFKTPAPYAAFVEALKQLLQQILTGDSDKTLSHYSRD
jgi:predicted ATPase